MGSNFSNRLKAVGTNVTSNTNSRSESELKIGLQNKRFIDSKFTRLIDAPTITGDYFQKDKNSSSYSERLKLLGDPNKANFFIKIEKFVAYNVSVSEEIDKKDEEDRSNIINLSDKTVVIPAGSIRPVEGDCFVLYSHQNIRKPFTVTKVVEKMLIDREVYEVTFKESNVYSYEELVQRVTSTYVFLESNVGSGNKVILEKDTVNIVKKLQTIMRDLNREYIEAFYDEQFDTIRVHHPNEPSLIYTLRSLSKFQSEEEILKYGFDEGTLIVNNDYTFNLDDSNYNQSIYKNIIKHKKLKKYMLSENVKSPVSEFISEMERIAAIHNEERGLVSINDNNQDLIGEYTFKFYERTFTNHIVLTNLYNSRVVLRELLEVDQNVYQTNNKHVSSFYYVHLNNPLYIDLLDIYYGDKDFNVIFDKISKGEFIQTLEDYSVYSYDIFDYIFFPVLRYIIEKCIEEVTKDQMFTSY